MKKIIIILFVLIGFTSFAQNKFFKVTCDSKMSIEKQKENGSFTFVFPSEIKKEQIDRTSKYYTKHFVVSANKSNIVQIRMVENNADNRKIIKRFFVGNKIEKIIYENSEYSVDEFYDKFIM